MSDNEPGRSSGTIRIGRIAEPSAVLWLAVLGLALVAAVQVWDLAHWAVTPWIGFTLDRGGRVSFSDPKDLPPALQSLAVKAPVFALAVRSPDAHWRALADPGSGPDVPWRRLAAELASKPEGSTFELRFASSAGEQVASVRSQRLPLGLFFECGLLLPLIGVVLAALAALVYRARPGAREAVFFALFAGLEAVEFIAGAVHGGPPSRLRVLEVAAAALAPAAALGLAVLLEPRPWIEKRPWLLLLPWAGSFLVLLIDQLIDGAERRPALAVLRMLTLLLFAAYVYGLRATTASRHRRRELGFYLAGMVAAFAVPVIAYSLPASSQVEPSRWVVLPILLFPATIGYGILRHRLFDIDLVLRRSALFAVLSATGLAVYGVLVAVAGALLGRAGADRSPILTAVFVVAAIAIGGALKSRLQRLVDRRLDPERFHYLEAVRKAGSELAALDSEDAVAESLARTATTVAGLEGAAVFLARGGRLEPVARSGPSAQVSSSSSFAFDEPLVRLLGLVASEIQRSDFDDNPRFASLRSACLPRMAELGAELLLVLGSGAARPLGLLALGRRRDGEHFNREDIDLFRALAAQATLGLGRARRRISEEEPTAAPATLSAGMELLHYRVVETLGQGGMGSVWRAFDRKLERPVALKLLLPERAGDRATLERLRREARTLAGLSHPNIVPIYALEEAQGLVFLVIELVEGPDLRQLLRARGPLTAAEAAVIGGEVATALGFALERGIIHRDVKLGNVLRTSAGVVKLTDFGLARPAGEGSSLTADGHVVGTLAYMAPELMAGKPADHRSDMYALGVLLHELVTGKNPWEGSSRARGAAPEMPGIEEPLASVLGRLLQPDPGLRYPDYRSLIAALRVVAG